MTRRSADFESIPEGAREAESKTYNMPENPAIGPLGHSCRHRQFGSEDGTRTGQETQRFRGLKFREGFVRAYPNSFDS